MAGKFAELSNICYICSRKHNTNTPAQEDKIGNINMANSNNSNIRFDKNGHLIGNGDVHADYFIEDMAGFPVKVSIEEASSTESVYVKYTNLDDLEAFLAGDESVVIRSATVRFSGHYCNGSHFGVYLTGRNNRMEILYRLGFAVKSYEECHRPNVRVQAISAKKAKNMPACPFTIAELEARGIGADLSDVQGTVMVNPMNSREYIVIRDAEVGKYTFKKEVITLK